MRNNGVDICINFNIICERIRSIFIYTGVRIYMRTNSDVTLNYYGVTGWRNAEKSLRTLLISAQNINIYPITLSIRSISKTYNMMCTI